jgi:hypothetical protein
VSDIDTVVVDSLKARLTLNGRLEKRTSLFVVVGHKRSSRLPDILLVSTSSARSDSKNVLSALFLAPYCALRPAPPRAWGLAESCP